MGSPFIMDSACDSEFIQISRVSQVPDQIVWPGLFLCIIASGAKQSQPLFGHPSLELPRWPSLAGQRGNDGMIPL